MSPAIPRKPQGEPKNLQGGPQEASEDTRDGQDEDKERQTDGQNDEDELPTDPNIISLAFPFFSGIYIYIYMYDI